ncbi:Aerotolerance-related protein BatD [Gemmatirosa kalamazoonensis]|uniref:Aerotolerance-related protein BatD n=1 Tax=Gemmatirosa kalamazoonensis TaxID=861299 RepID=W0RIV0_9BACT|nr:BatD family protein [Gemmatirosa kalamazoonensis]AHG90691.1 Aerotolerance-related protein BatD [Gemmatirosa kalamazoonensis]
MSPVAALVLAVLRLLAQIGVTVSAPTQIGPRDPALVQVEITAPAGRDVRLVPPSFAPFRLVTANVVSGVDSGAVRRGAARSAWQTIEHRFVLAPPANAAGHYTFAPFEARVTAPGMRDALARSAAWAITVRGPPPTSGDLPAIVERASIEPSKGINFHALALPETVYVGQQVTYQVGVFLDEAVRTRLRRNPEFLPPELRGLLAYELPAGRTSLRDRVIAGKKWDVHVFQRAVFPLEAGRTDVPPAQLSYSLPLSLGFFSREESYTARSEPASIVGVAPPLAGRPSDWVGAVGVLRASSRLDTATTRVGDPLVLTLRVEGTANVKLLPRPPLSIAWGTAVPGEERVTVDSTALLVRGAKEFDWIVTPRTAGDQEVPTIRYPYFDPYRRVYDVATSTPLPVAVSPGTLAAATSDSVAPHALEIRRVDFGPVAAPVSSRALFWLIVLLAPLPAVVLVVARRPRRVRPTPPPAARLRDVARGATAADVRRVRQLFGGALAERLALRDAGADVASARAGVLTRRLRRAGVTPETATAVEAFARRLDAVSYSEARDAASATRDGRLLADEAHALLAAVDREARTRVALHTAGVARRAIVLRALLVAALGAAAATAARAAARARAETEFERGVAAYATRRYAEAALHFTTAARAEVRSPDAWANAGTAAWVVGDTVGAAVGWQRAIRLDPRAADLRVRLDLLPASQDGWIAGVPPLPLDWAALTGLAMWVAACAAGAARLAGRGRSWPIGSLGTAALLGASASALLCAQLARVHAARDLAVVRVSGPLHAEPALGSEVAGPVEATDVARVTGRRTVWARVALDGGRQGWIESDRLIWLAP